MSDYYAFGMLMVGRNWSAGEYRYGFNGKENDDEVNGVGNNVDFGARMYDSRLGRWLSLDPLMAKYPGMSPYNAMADNPIIYKDPDGRDFEISLLPAGADGRPTIQITCNIYAISQKGFNQVQAAAGEWNNAGPYIATINGVDYNVAFNVQAHRPVNDLPNDENNVETEDQYNRNYRDQETRTLFNLNINRIQNRDNYANYYGGNMLLSNIVDGNGNQIDAKRILREMVVVRDGTNEFVGGITVGKRTITMKLAFFTQQLGRFRAGQLDCGTIVRLVTHEIGHLMGLNDRGVLNNRYYSENGVTCYNGVTPKAIHQDDIKNILKVVRDSPAGVRVNVSPEIRNILNPNGVASPDNQINVRNNANQNR